MKYINSNHKTVINDRKWKTLTATTNQSHQQQEMKYINTNHKTPACLQSRMLQEYQQISNVDINPVAAHCIVLKALSLHRHRTEGSGIAQRNGAHRNKTRAWHSKHSDHLTEAEALYSPLERGRVGQHHGVSVFNHSLKSFSVSLQAWCAGNHCRCNIHSTQCKMSNRQPNAKWQDS